jgi:hypothetical protein
LFDTQVPLFDLHLMLAVNGKERSLAECNALFDKVGLRTIKTTPLDNGYVVIETAAASAVRTIYENTSFLGQSWPSSSLIRLVAASVLGTVIEF